MTNKKVYIEALGLVEGHFSGVGQYILGILRGLDELMDQAILSGDEIPDIRVVIPYTSLKKFKSFGFKHLRAKRLPITFRAMSILWYTQKMPPIDLWCGKGYYIFTRFVSMPLLFSKSAVVIYDMSFELFKQYSDEKNAIFLSKGTKKSVNAAHKVFTISESAKKDILDFYKVPASKVIIATPATDQKHFYRRSASEIARVKQKYNISGNYILALSNLEPRKNLNSLVDAYCMLPKKYREKTALLLVGVSGWRTDELFKKITSRVAEGYAIVRPSSYVTDADKPAIISGASLLVYPSHYEGFGMPPLEAMACGVPVISANNSSLPEVMGNYGKMLDCNNTVKLEEDIQNFLDSSDALLAKSIISGPKRAENFSWAKSAMKYWQLIKEVTK